MRTSLGVWPSKSQLPKPLLIPELDEIVARHRRATQDVAVTVTGRSLPLLYLLISTLAGPKHQQAVVVVDAEGRFDATRLTCRPSDLAHVYVYRPARGSPEHLREVVAGAESYMLYGEHGSKAREWWGTVVVGGVRGGDVNAGWRGWLRVDREEVAPFGMGISVEEALGQRDRRQECVDAMVWTASSEWGDFSFEETGSGALVHPVDTSHN